MAMSGKQLPRVISQRGKSGYEIEIENFERRQHTSLTKAVSAQEIAVKEKHVRIAIIGTHKNRGALLFWNIAVTLPLQGNPITCWKFLHVLHKVLREGHPQCVKDSLRYEKFVGDLGRFWGHLKMGYSYLIEFYTKLMKQKLAFHKKYPEFPGNLLIGDDDFDKLVGTDINSYFELSVDMLDYMDAILLLQTQVFNSLDMSRAVSLSSSGQCRLAPLIMCILDSCQLYDYTVKLLFRLHASLPPDTLEGHRGRFYQQYKVLKQFYDTSRTLEYFKNLITIPQLPKTPPNFLVAAELASHVKPVAVVPEPEPEPAEPEVMSPEEAFTDSLIDMSASSEPDLMQEEFMQQNGAPPMAQVPDERDMLIERLMQELNELKAELARIKAEDQMLIESLQTRVYNLEEELHELTQIAESTQNENETLKNMISETSSKAEMGDEAKARLQQVEKIAQVNDDKFKKMKAIYEKLKGEHVKLLRTNADVKKEAAKDRSELDIARSNEQTAKAELNNVKIEKSRVEQRLTRASNETGDKMQQLQDSEKQLQEENKKLKAQVAELTQAKTGLDATVTDSQAQVSSLKKSLNEATQLKAALDNEWRVKMDKQTQQILSSTVDESIRIIKSAVDQFDTPHMSTVTCTAEYLLSRCDPTQQVLQQLKDAFTAFSNNPQDLIPLLCEVAQFSHHLSDLIIMGRATSNAAPIDLGNELVETCRSTADESIVLLDCIKHGSTNLVPAKSKTVRDLIKRLITQGETLLPKIEDVKAEQMGDLIDQEMAQTVKAIEKASARIAEMLEKSRSAHSGIQLEVNEKILDSCTDLMKAIYILIDKSKVLQREIVAQGRGTSSAKEFYKKHHRWTEGLISAAKAVGFGANVLVDAADKVSSGDGKFEQLVVCAQEIAASTTQLTVASKVKADSTSKNLPPLSDASKRVTDATAQVVASAKSGAQLIDEQNIYDFSHLTLHQAKLQEMEAQVHVLELQSDLERERVRLSQLRKKHYQLAGESEGRDEQDMVDLEVEGEGGFTFVDESALSAITYTNYDDDDSETDISGCDYESRRQAIMKQIAAMTQQQQQQTQQRLHSPAAAATAVATAAAGAAATSSTDAGNVRLGIAC